MNRRKFMKVSGGLLAVSALGGPFANQPRAAEQIAVDIKSFFEWKDPAVIRLTEEVFQKCILGKVFPAEAPMKHNWISPGGKYRGQWIWDTMFVVDLLSILPGKEKVIRDVFQNYWDFQVRWNKKMPEYAHDMIPCISEYYDSISGKTLGVDFLGMTCTVVTLMLDGLCKKHRLDVRKIPK